MKPFDELIISFVFWHDSQIVKSQKEKTKDARNSLPISTEMVFSTFARMDLWLKRLEAELENLTKGDNDVTMATQFSNVYQSAFDEGVGYTIETPNGESILSSMVDKISDIFDKNIQALEVHINFFIYQVLFEQTRLR